MGSTRMPRVVSNKDFSFSTKMIMNRETRVFMFVFLSALYRNNAPKSKYIA